MYSWTFFVKSNSEGGLAMTKTVMIDVSDSMLSLLKNSNYKICIAKYIAGDSKVRLIWYSDSNFYPENTFSWTPEYSIFYTNNFTPFTSVNPCCTPAAISLGQQVTLDKFGRLSNAVTGGKKNKLCLDNQFGLIYPGLCQSRTGINGLISSEPFYVMSLPVMAGLISLQPLDIIKVWFEIDKLDNTKGIARTLDIDLDLSLKDQTHILFDNQTWTITG